LYPVRFVMDRNFDLSLTVAICVSLLIHGIMIDALVEWHAHQLEAELFQPGEPRQAGLSEGLLAADSADANATPPPVIAPAPAQPKAAKPELPKPPPPPRKPPMAPKPPPFYVDTFGEHGGTGEAARSSPGKQSMQGMKFDVDHDQPYLSRNPNAEWGFNPDTFPSRPSAGEGGSNGANGGGAANAAKPADDAAGSQAARATPAD
jgi:hypothetical protein